MAIKIKHSEIHSLGRRGWLRAFVLGANDGVVSIAALVMTLIAAQVSSTTLWISGISALTAGAFSMGIGEYVSVSSQKDVEEANIKLETSELKLDPQDELLELAGIYRNRGLSKELAMEVAKELTDKDALTAHLRDELNIVERDKAQPFQAAYVSFIAFSVGGIFPFAIALFSRSTFTSTNIELLITGIATLLSLCLLGFSSAKLGGAPVMKSLYRIVIGGIAALVVTSLLGTALG